MTRKYRKQSPPTAINKDAARQLQMAMHLYQNNQPTPANTIFQRLLAEHPREPLVHYYYGNLLWTANQPDLAAKHYRIAVKLNTHFVEALGNLGAALWVLGEREEAIACYKKVIKLDPRNAQAFHNLGGAYYQQGNGVDTINAFRSALKIDPEFADAYKHLGNSYYEQGQYEEAMRCYEKVASLTPSGGAKVRLAATIPMIPDSIEHLYDIRRRINAELDNLLDQKIQIGDPIQENGYTNFFLAYHGEDDRPLQEKYAQLYSSACTSLTYTAKHCLDYNPQIRSRKIKVGFISSNLMDHSIGNTSKGIIALLCRERFEATAIFLSPPRDSTGRFIAQAADNAVILPGTLAAARETIANLELDILFYQDTGLDPFTFFLAFSRLAPIQCTSFGHPVTTGIPKLDYYISTDLWEPEDGNRHYSETLVRLRNVASVAYYYKPPTPARFKSRREFGLKTEDHIYICPQTLFKLHPQFDEILRGILRADPAGVIILIEGKHPYWAEILRRRFAVTMPDVVKRILFLPRQSGEDFISLIAASDVMLDTIHFCGFNTTLQGFSVGTPVVTLPGRFMRSRHTLSFYRKMHYMDLVANDTNDYIEIAVKLGTDPACRQIASQQVLKCSEILWEEKEVIQEFERFFQQAVGAYPQKHDDAS